MRQQLQPALTPRRGNVLKVLAVCRISGDNQDTKSLGDQEALLQNYVEDHFGGTIDLKPLATKGSGERIDREELRDLDIYIASRMFDLVITEDLGRICRRIHALLVCEDAVSCGTRLIAINDRVDTEDPNWRMNAMFATVRHEQYNVDTSARIRRSVRNRFTNDGLVHALPYGYIKPERVKSDNGVTKDPLAERVYEVWFRKLEEGASYSEVMDWLNQEKIPPGPCVKSGRWSVSLIRTTTFNPILKGFRHHNVMKSERDNATGRHRSVKAAPSELLIRSVPHLAFIEAERYDRITAMLRVRNANLGRKPIDGKDPRFQVPRKQTVWPGQHVTCGICGRLLYYGGDGRSEALKCSGAHQYLCWMGTTCLGSEVAEQVSAAILREVAALPEFESSFLDEIRQKQRDLRLRHQSDIGELERRATTIKQKIATTTDNLTEAKGSQALLEKLRELEVESEKVKLSLHERKASVLSQPELPSMTEIKLKIPEAFANLARNSPEFGRLMHRLVPKLEVRPYRLCNRQEPILRAHVTLELFALNPKLQDLAKWGDGLTKEIVVDLFDLPQRVTFREEVMRLRDKGLTKMAIVARTGLTHTAVQAAVSVDVFMKQAGTNDPYVPITEPPEDDCRLRLHRHNRYKFEPLPRPSSERRNSQTDSVV